MAVTKTNILAAGTTALRSASVVVDAGQVVKLLAYAAGGLNEKTYGIVEELNSAGAWVPVIFDGDPLAIGFDASRGLCSSVLLYGPGEYSVNRPVQPAGANPLAVDKVV